MFRANYSYDSKYLLTATIRRDGFSAFGADYKYGIFPSIALGWNIESEPFMENLKWIDRAKLRLSYGENGNQAISAYDSMASLSENYYVDNEGNAIFGFYPNKLADPTLSWETTRQFNIGLDYSFFKGRIFGSIDAYFANTYDLLLNKQIPEINGVKQIRQNIGETKSYGVELALSTVNIRTKDFSWKTDLTFSHDRNEIVNVGLFDENGKALNNVGNSWFIGKPIDVIYAYKFDGIWQESDDILNSHMPDAKPGDIKVEDYNKDGKLSKNEGEDDRQIIGYRDPKFRAGLMNTLTYKDFTFSFFINSVYGITRGTEYMSTFFDAKSNIRQREWWTPENKINTFPANRDDSNPHSVYYFGKYNDASYLRLSDISLSYRVPSKILDKLNLSRLEFFGNVKNVCILTDYAGLDPEFTSDFTTPPARTYIFGLRLGF